MLTALYLVSFSPTTTRRYVILLHLFYRWEKPLRFTPIHYLQDVLLSPLLNCISNIKGILLSINCCIMLFHMLELIKSPYLDSSLDKVIFLTCLESLLFILSSERSEIIFYKTISIEQSMLSYIKYEWRQSRLIIIFSSYSY